MSDLDVCVRCGLCLQSCPTFQLTGMEGYSPRGRIQAAKLIDAGERSPVLTDFIDTCLGCRACESVCPAGVPYGAILESARAQLGPVRRRRFGEGVGLWFVAKRWRLSVASLGIWLLQRLGIAAAAKRGPVIGQQLAAIPRLRIGPLTRRIGSNFVPPDGVAERGQVVLFTGCVQDAWERDVHYATIAVLTRAGYRVRVPYGQVCCGALHAHSGRDKAARKLGAANVHPLEQFDGPIIVSSAGCGARLKEYGHVFEGRDRAVAVAARVTDVLEFLSVSDIKRLKPVVPEGLRRIAVHDACHHNFAQGITRQPRILLAAAGFEVLDLNDGGRCCGAAGSYAASHPDWARPLRDDKVAAISLVEPDAVAVANPGCSLWIGTHEDAPLMLHPMQLIALAVVGR